MSLNVSQVSSHINTYTLTLYMNQTQARSDGNVTFNNKTQTISTL